MTNYAEIFANGVNSESIARAGELARANIHFIIDCAYYSHFYNYDIIVEENDHSITSYFRNKNHRSFLKERQLGYTPGPEFFEPWEIPSRMSAEYRNHMLSKFLEAKPKANTYPFGDPLIFGTGGEIEEGPFPDEAFKELFNGLKSSGKMLFYGTSGEIPGYTSKDFEKIWDASFEKKDYKSANDAWRDTFQ